MNYSAIPDIFATVFLGLVAAVLLFNLVVSWYFGRKSSRMYRRGGMWGGE
jgi:hypothetical protein